MKVKLLIFLILLSSFFWLVPEARALRKRSRGQAVQNVGVSQGVKAQVKLRSDHQALLINFSGFNSNIKEVAYELVYEANGIGQAVSATVPLGDTSTKTLYFGTCSSGTCVPHTNIQNMRLSLITTLSSGKKILKPYRIKP